MRTDFEEGKRLLYEQYDVCTMEERRRILCHLRRKNVLLYRQLERVKHDLLRLESKRVQLELAGNEQQVVVIEKKILKKKEQFLKALARNRE